MKDLDSRLKEAFALVHADETMKASAMVYVREESKKCSSKAAFGKFRPAAALALALLVFFSGYFSRMLLEPVSVISIDINPSIELGINSFDHVVSVKAFNEDGKELANRLDLRFLNYQEAVERVVSSETVTELLSREEVLVIAVVGEDEVRNARLCSSLEDYAVSGGGGHCYSVPLRKVQEAHSCGMSYGKYLVYQETLARDAALTAEETRDMTMKEIQELTEGTSCPTETHCEETVQSLTPSVQHHGHSGNKHKNGHH